MTMSVLAGRLASYGRTLRALVSRLPGGLDLSAGSSAPAADCLRLARGIVANPWLPSHHVDAAAVAQGLFLSRLLRTHRISTSVDVGANRGQFAEMIRRFGFEGDIVSLEPDEGSAAELRRRAEQDAHWRVLQVAAGQTGAEAQLNRFPDSTFNSLHLPNEAGMVLFQTMRVEPTRSPVRLTTLDDLLESGELGACDPPILLKTDTQGSDLAVLKGASRLLERCQVVVTELALKPIYSGAASGWSTYRLLRKSGFRLASVHDVSNDAESGELIELNGVFVRIQ